MLKWLKWQRLFHEECFDCGNRNCLVGECRASQIQDYYKAYLYDLDKLNLVKLAFGGKVSISPTFYERLFCTKVFRAAFLYLHCRFKLFRCKEIGAKAARKMLVKLTQGRY